MTKEQLLEQAKPILFNTEMVRAILDNRKKATRRTVKFIGTKNPNWTGYIKDGLVLYNGNNEPCSKKPPYFIGDTLYVRETWAFMECIICNGNYRRPENSPPCYDTQAVEYDDGDSISDGCFIYRAGCKTPERIIWRPSIHMPKAAARIFLKVKDVRIERLQDITEEQAKLEGAIDNRGHIHSYNNEYDRIHSAREHFAIIWNSTIKKVEQNSYSWEANPWVWVIEFERIIPE